MRKFIIVLLSCFIPCLHAYQNAEELKLQTLEALPGLVGWCSPEKAANFIDLVLAAKPQVCVEIGVFGGRSLFPVAQALKFLGQGIVIGIDPWDNVESTRNYDPVRDTAHIDWWGKKIDFNSIYNSYLSMLKKYQLEDHVITLKMTSQKAAGQIQVIDILHLDGNHSELSSTEDVLLFLPKVRPGGYIWLNDTTWPNTVHASELLLEACDVIMAIDIGQSVCVLFKKRS